jgi:putative FmdB family regulatory protein
MTHTYKCNKCNKIFDIFTKTLKEPQNHKCSCGSDSKKMISAPLVDVPIKHRATK